MLTLSGELIKKNSWQVNLRQEDNKEPVLRPQSFLIVIYLTDMNIMLST